MPPKSWLHVHQAVWSHAHGMAHPLADELAALRAQIESDQRLLIQFAEEKVQLAVQVREGSALCRQAAGRCCLMASAPHACSCAAVLKRHAAAEQFSLHATAQPASFGSQLLQGYDLLEQHLAQADLDIVHLEAVVSPVAPCLAVVLMAVSCTCTLWGCTCCCAAALLLFCCRPPAMATVHGMTRHERSCHNAAAPLLMCSCKRWAWTWAPCPWADRTTGGGPMQAGCGSCRNAAGAR